MQVTAMNDDNIETALVKIFNQVEIHWRNEIHSFFYSTLVSI